MMHMTDEPITPMPTELWSLFEMHAELCKALANEHRLAILYALGPGEMCVGDLAVVLGIPMHKVSQHLRILKERMLVRPRKDGKSVYYSITNPKFIEGCTKTRQALIEQHQAAGRSLLAAELLDAMQHSSVKAPTG
jgi:DNA-binding transcriptional ArsR family regulator